MENMWKTAINNTRAVFAVLRKELKEALSEDDIKDINETEMVVIMALKKQIPKEPKKQDKENLFCPTCDCFLGFESVCMERNFNQPHCSCCGQAIKWECD